MHALRVLPAALLLLLPGCVSDDASDPLDPADTDPSGAAGATGAADGGSLEPLVFEGTVTGGADCGLHGTLGTAPQTPETIQLPPEASGRIHRLETTATDTAPGVGATCLLFSDGTLRDAGETDRGRVPDGVDWVQVITNFNAGLEYRLTIE